MQWDLFRNQNVTGSENCLYLNVYTLQTHLESKEDTTLLPVMVWLYMYSVRGAFLNRKSMHDACMNKDYMYCIVCLCAGIFPRSWIRSWTIRYI